MPRFTGAFPYIPNFLYQKDLFLWGRTPDGKCESKVKQPVPLELAAHLEMTGKSGLLNMFCMNKVYAFGPKLLKLSNVDFQILENTDLNFNISEYAQPFPAMVVEFPEDYQNQKIVADPLKGEISLTGHIHKEAHKPVFAIVVYNKEVNAIVISVYLDSKDVYAKVLAENDLTVEYQLSQLGREPFDKALITTDDELEVFINVSRAALNACLLMTVMGTRSLGPENPKHHRRLKHFVDVAEKSKNQDRVAKARRELKTHPMCFGFEQDIKLKVRRETDHTIDPGTGKRKGPHLRRGHWRFQRHGPNRTLVKKIWIAPVFINPDLFFGDDRDTEVVYHD